MGSFDPGHRMFGAKSLCGLEIMTSREGGRRMVGSILQTYCDAVSRGDKSLMKLWLRETVLARVDRVGKMLWGSEVTVNRVKVDGSKDGSSERNGL